MFRRDGREYEMPFLNGIKMVLDYRVFQLEGNVVLEVELKALLYLLALLKRNLQETEGGLGRRNASDVVPIRRRARDPSRGRGRIERILYALVT